MLRKLIAEALGNGDTTDSDAVVIAHVEQFFGEKRRGDLIEMPFVSGGVERGVSIVVAREQ